MKTSDFLTFLAIYQKLAAKVAAEKTADDNTPNELSMAEMAKIAGWAAQEMVDDGLIPEDKMAVVDAFGVAFVELAKAMGEPVDD